MKRQPTLTASLFGIPLNLSPIGFSGTFLSVFLGAILFLGGCSNEVTGPTPELDQVTPNIICNAQLTTEVKLSGDFFSPLPVDTLTGDPLIDLPDVTILASLDLDGNPAEAQEIFFDGKSSQASEYLKWQSKQSLLLTMDPELALSDALFSVSVKNPNGNETLFADSLLAVPPPTLSNLNPDLLCGEKANDLHMVGTGLLNIPGSKLEVLFQNAASDVALDSAILEECQDLPGTSGASRCTELDIAIAENTLDAGTASSADYDVLVHNPESAACTSPTPLNLTIVPAPIVVSVKPEPICVAQGDIPVTISGSFFLTVDSLVPTLGIGTLEVSTVAVTSSCTEITSPTASVFTCTELEATIPQDALAAGIHDAFITNPAPANCVSSDAAPVHIVPPPTLSNAVPPIACVEQDSQILELEGSDFLIFDASTTPITPSVDIDGSVFASTYDVADCTALLAPPADALVCSAISVSLPNDLGDGQKTVTVTNPDPAGCISEAIDFFIVPPPTLLQIEPAALCLAQGDVELVVDGTDLLLLDLVLPSLVLENTADSSTVEVAADSATGCTDLFSDLSGSQVCTSLIFTLSENTAATVDTFNAWLQNPSPAACISNTMPLMRYPEAALSGTPAIELCTGGGSVAITGTGISPAAVILFGDTPADSMTVAADGTSAIGYFPMLPPDTNDVSLANAEGCLQTIATNQTVETGAMAFFVDPPVIFNGINTRITLYASGLTASVAIDLVASDDTRISIDASNIDSSNPDKIQITIPKDESGVFELPAGTYNIEAVGSGGACERAYLTNAIEVVDTTTIVLDTLSPGFGHTDSATAITITALNSGESFQAIPKVYLTSASGTGVATSIGAVSVLDDWTLTALIPDGLAVDSYDIIIVNPNGEVGVASESIHSLSFIVVADPPPQIASISPGFVSYVNPITLTIEGENFDAFADVKIELFCDDAAGTITTQEITASSGDDTSLVSTFTSTATTEVFCLVRVTNTNATFDEFSSLVILGNDQKLFPFEAGPDLNIARRGLAGAAGRTTNSARYVYAIGGDNATDGVLDSVEATAVDIKGTPFGFKVLQQTLTTPRTQHGAITAGRFVYVVGGTDDGSDNANTLGSVERAYILSTDERPAVTDVNLEVTSATDTDPGLGAGTWYYRISAVMDAADDFNPGGESLPSEAFAIRLPDLGSDYLAKVTLTWSALPGAAAYRIYRTPVGTSILGDETLLFETADETVLSFADGGAAPGSEMPLQIGALGVWHEIDISGSPLALNTARKGAATVMAMAPDKQSFVIYTFLGQGVTGLPQSYEWVNISIENDGRQIPNSNFQEVDTTANLNARWLLGAWVAVPENSANVLTENFVYIGGGESSTGIQDDSFDYAEIDWSNDGVLIDFVQQGGSAGMQPENAYGYGAIIANNYIYAFGGGKITDNGAGTDVGYQTFICAAGESGCGGGIVAPTVTNWTSATTENPMTTARHQMGIALESAIIYIMGGQSGTAATTSTEMTVW